MIPIVSGNLGVDALLHARAGAPPPGAAANEAAIARMAALGAGGVEEYLAWALVEPARDRFDWSGARATAAAAHARGLRYLVYPWLHVVPEWFRASGDFVPLECLEHGATCGWPSPFAPATLAAFERFFTALRAALGDAIDALCVAFPADYGEAGFPTGMATWVNPLPPPHDHVHAGFWCGDPHARAAWERFAAELGAPRDARELLPRQGGRPLLARFLAEAMARFADQLLGAARAAFPATPLWIKVGHGGELAEYGVDATLLARAAARHGAGVRTTQASLPWLHQQRLATPCRWFAVPFASEPPADVGREAVAARLFDDAATGVVEAFDYPEFLDGARDLLRRDGALRRGVAPLCDVALHFARDALHEQEALALPPQLHRLADALRDRFDFAVVDRTLIAAGALAPLRVVGLLEGALDGSRESVAEQEELLRFVASGGTLLVGAGVRCDAGPLARRLAPLADAGAALRLGATPPASSVVRMGTPGEEQWLFGEWHAAEEACQFVGGAARGERARWSGAGAGLLLARPAGRRALLELECWSHPRFVGQRRSVALDGVPLGEVDRAGLQRFAAWLPAPSDDRASALNFGGDLVVPAERGLGADRRALGVALLWWRVTAEGEPALPLAAAAPPLFTATIERERLATLEGRCGGGALLRLASGPEARFVALLEALVRERSEWGRRAPRVAAGVRLARFADGWLAWNRGGAPANLAGRSLPAGALGFEIDRPPGATA
ncbi:MAG: hypothetical protein JNL90_04505 [Planctomycetes bacterium]|nr:hypothetical protein [Planctomycetota bacterium]